MEAALINDACKAVAQVKILVNSYLEDFNRMKLYEAIDLLNEAIEKLTYRA